MKRIFSYIGLMDRHKFKRLPLREQLRWVYCNGQCVGSIRYYSYKVLLYLLNGYYVEVFYHNNQSVIEKVELFNYNNSRLQFYEDQISLQQLVK